MAYYLSIDVGNTRTKFGLFEDKELIHQKTLMNEDLLLNNELFNQYELSGLIVSSVNSEAEKLLSFSLQEDRIIWLTHLTKLPYRIAYQSPETLGKDRIACVAAAHAIFPNQDVLVIDSGTCVTYDFIDANGVYYGGAIAPGVQMRLKAMHEFTDQLPLLNWNYVKPKALGNTTITSMLSGAVNGLINEINGFIQDYGNVSPKMQVILTGGDAHLFEKELKNGIFADPNLVLKGLNEILIYNCE